jgi:biotin-dependent carboxylase-like uncharacterized protein
VGNAEGEAGLEMTLAGGTFEFDSNALVAIAGADFEAGIPLWTAVEMKAGEQVRCGHARQGARCYLCVRGGIDVPPVLGSASTHLLTAMGGLEGRPLKRGDVLDVAQALMPAAPGLLPAQIWSASDTIRVTSPTDASPLCAATWQVKEDSDRMGLRLRGPALERCAGHMLTEGVPLGAIQVPPDGQPIILFVEHQTTGGYPKIANVISADFHRVGQLRPRDQVRFEQVSIETALTLLRTQEDWLHSLAERARA